MQGKLKASTIMETIVAMLILMISFSAGMVIYNRVLVAGVNEQAMRAEMVVEFLADSLVNSDKPEAQRITRSGQIYEITFRAAELHPGLSVMTVEHTDQNKKKITAHTRLVDNHE